LAFDIQASYGGSSSSIGRKDVNAISVKKMTNETLLKALLDDDQTIRLMAQNFWIEKANMPSSTIDRMVLILENMYSPQTERDYLSYSTNLLLEKTSKSPDFNRFIYENPLSECVFREYNLSADWRRRHEMMTPLFIETVNSFQDSSLQADASSLSQHGFNLRATQIQSLQFQPTQEVSSSTSGSNHGKAIKSPYNWLTQSSIDTLQSSLALASHSFGETQSSMLFSHRKFQPNSDKSDSSNSSSSSSNQDILRLRRRFIKDKGQTEQSRFFCAQTNRTSKQRSRLEEAAQDKAL
jgi:DNA-dependent protein kinase catalytic subunit